MGGGLSPEAVAAVERMLAHIDAHLREPITAAELAAAAGYSQYHAARLFARHVGQVPFDYIRERRLVGAAVALRGAPIKVVDVAFAFTFDSHEGFTRAFTRAFGISPWRFAHVPAPTGWRIPFRPRRRAASDRKETTMSQEAAVIFTQIVERPARKLLLRRSRAATEYFSYCEEFGCVDDVGTSVPWSVLVGITEALGEPAGLWLPDNLRTPGTGVYAHGVDVPADYDGPVPEGFDLIDLPAAKLLVFQGEPYDDAHYAQAIGALWDRVATFNPEVYGYEYAEELAPRMQLEPQGWRGYIELRPVREKR